MSGFIRPPPFAPGQRIGVLGGSFNPPHAGHVLVSELALRKLGLHRVWWLVTPGNPLKSPTELAPVSERLVAARALIRDPRIVVTDVEAQLRFRFTCDTLDWLRKRTPGVDLVWIMGADNLRQFHLWRRWREIAAAMPMLVVDRPGSTLRAAFGHAGATLAAKRIPDRDARLLPSAAPPAWLFLHGPRSALSSTLLRRRKSFVKKNDNSKTS